MPERKILSVRSKILVTVLVSIAVFSVVVYLISSQILLSSYLSIERASMEQNLRRATDAIGEFSDQQLIKLSDWAAWDEAYNYTATLDPSWPPTSIYPSSMANLDNSLAMFTDLTGGIVFIMMSDISLREEITNDSARQFFTEHADLVTHTTFESQTQGLVMLTEGPMIIVSLPVKTSEGTGPLHGALTFGRFLDEEKIKAFGDITHLALSTYRVDATDLPEHVHMAKNKLIQGEQFVIEPLTYTVLTGYTLLNDVHGKPALILKVETPRPIYAQGNVTFTTFMALGAGALLLFGLLMMLLLERFVIVRFVRLTNDVEKINIDHDLTIRVSGGEKDEVGRLAEKINQLLTWLTDAKQGEAASRREIVNLLDELKREKELKEEMSVLLPTHKPPQGP